MFRRKAPRTLSQRLDRLAEAARETEFYRPLLPAGSGLSLDNLPYVSLQQFECNPARFRCNRRQNPEVTFRYLLKPEPVIKVLVTGFSRRPWLVGPEDDHAFDTLAGPVPILRQVAAAARPLRFPCIAFTGPVHGMLSGDDRDLLWRAFRVPVFEQLLGVHGEVLAEECEAHDGLHVREEDVLFESFGDELAVTSLRALRYPVFRLRMGLSGRLERSPCGCGLSSPRLLDIHIAPRRNSVAATA